jgi:hypothetical protein
MYFQVDRRIGYQPKFFVSEKLETLVRIPDQIGKCVVFAYYRKAMADPPKPAGTVFYVGVRDEHAVGVVYLVTARHVIEDCFRNSQDGKILLRVQRRGSGLDFWETTPEDWYYHPTDATVDVAVFPLKAREEDVHARDVLLNLDFHPYDASVRTIATPKIIADEGIGQGDEVFIVGLFVNRPGKDDNIPISRIGNIAAMPKELVKTRWHDREIEAYLIEARSIGGLSGSPVFVHLGPLRFTKHPEPGKMNVQYATHRSGPHFLLGLVHAHFNLDLLDIPPDSVEEDSPKTREINCGIAIVVPVEKIMEVLNHPDLVKERVEARNEEIASIHKQKAAVPD